MNNREKQFVFNLLLFAGLCTAFLPASLTLASAKGSPQVSSLASSIPLDFPTDQLIISFRSSSQAFRTPATADQMNRLAQATGVVLQYIRSMSDNANVYKLPERLPLDQVQNIASLLTVLPDVFYAEPDQIRHPSLVPDDTYFSAYQWDLFDSSSVSINVQPAWDITTGSSSIVIAIGDTGLTNHADLSGRMISGTVAGSGYDFINTLSVANDGNLRDSDPSDPGDWVVSNECGLGTPAENSSWHGTHVAGTIGAASNNSQGITGINWNSKLLILRVLGKCGGYDSDITDAMRWAAGLSVSGVPANANPAKVINLSLGGTGTCSSTWQNAINAVNAAGMVVVVAAGNSNLNLNSNNYSPAKCNNVITVAATSKSGSRATYSNYGATVEISAPGGSGSDGILSTINAGTTIPAGDTYALYQGTSMATPHVVGVVSLMFSVNSSLTPAQVQTILQGTARAFPGGSTCNTSICGSGIVDAGAAVAAAQPLGPFAKTSPTNGATGEATSLSLSWGSSARATGYSYCIDTTNNSACDGNWTSVGNTNTAPIIGLLSNTNYYWQVRASNSWVSDAYADADTWGSFTTSSYTLSVSKTGSGSGGVSSLPTGIDCGATCSAFFDYPTSVTLTAVASTGSTFTGWSGACTGTGTCIVTMDAAKSVAAGFTLNTYSLTIGKVGFGNGTVSSVPTGIDCGSTCSYYFAYNTVVILAASPTSPSTFDGWSGAGCSGIDTCTITITNDTLLMSKFSDPTVVIWTVYLPFIIK